MKKNKKIINIIALASLILLTISFAIFDRNKISAMKNELRNNRDFYIGVSSDMGNMSFDHNGMHYNNGENVNFSIGRHGMTMSRHMKNSMHRNSNWTEGPETRGHHYSHMGDGRMGHMNGWTGHMDGWTDRENLQLINQYNYPVNDMNSLKLEGVNTNFVTAFHKGSDILVEVYSPEKEVSIESDLKNKVLDMKIHDEILNQSSLVMIYFPEKVNKDIVVESSNGQIILESGKNIEAYTTNGNISIYSDSQKIKFESINGNVDISYRDTEINGETINGEIRIFLESPLDAKVNLESVNGYISTEGIENYQGKNLKKNYGNGKNTINLESVSGNIIIR